jgi:predicted metal-dependent phosphoesterase TrpH
MALRLALKCDFHMHVQGDPHDTFISYTPEDLINYAAKCGFEVLSITAHHKIMYSPYLRDYAANKNILLIPGVEATVEGHHILLINYLGNLDFKSIEDLRRIKRPDTLIIPAHPFFPGTTGVRDKLLEHIDIFDGIEFCHFYHPWINFNKKAVRIAKDHSKPLIGTSDAHFLMQMNHTFSVVEVNRKTAVGVVEAIKQGNVRVVSKPLSAGMILKVLSQFRGKVLGAFRKW